MPKARLLLLAPFVGLPLALLGCDRPTPADPRSAPPLVRVVAVQAAASAGRSFTGTVAARVQSDLGFRVPGKVVGRLVDVGQSVRRGQLLLRIDPVDLKLAARGQEEVVAATRARARQAIDDEARFRDLRGTGAISATAYDQARAAADAARAQLRAAEAQAEVGRNATRYADLVADADGVVMEIAAEPGQVVAAGQTVLRLAQAGRREAVVQLPETLRPEVGTVARTTVFGREDAAGVARLRQLSGAADRTTRTFEARYVLEGDLADAPLGGTVTIRIADGTSTAPEGVQVPIGAMFDAGKGPGVWLVEGNPARVAWRPVAVRHLDDDGARVGGDLKAGDRIVALGAHLLRDGQSVRTGEPVAAATDFQRRSTPVSEGRFNLSALAVRERAVTLFLICLISLAGIVAFLKLGRAEDPAFTVKVMTIVTAWPGATAQEMQDQVADRIENRMQELRWYDRVETYTRPGLAFTVLTLLDGTPPAEVAGEFYQARKKAGDEARNLPTGVIGPMINDEYSDVTFALFALKGKGEPQRLLVREAEALRQRLLHVPGVKKVDLIGEQPERIHVEFAQERLATLGVSPQDVFAALNGQNALTPSGTVETRGPSVFVRLDGAFDELQKIRDTPVVARGRTLKLSDVATVRRGHEDPATFLVRNGGEPALLLGVVMRDGWNGLDLGRSLDAEVAAIGAGLPLGLSLTKVTDQSVNIASAVDEFMVKFVVALLVVMGVSFASMGWRVGLVVAAAVPLTLAVVFIFMAATGRNFDRITLGSLILALGLLVDDAIIAIEMMVVKMEEGYDRVAASAYAWSHTAAPMLSGTLVTAVGFMPNGFARSTAGEYTSNMFWIVGAALIASWIVAVVFTPYLGVKLLPELGKAGGGHAALYDTPRHARFRRLLGRVIARKWWVAVVVAGLFALSIGGMAVVKKQFFPISDRPEVLVEVQMPHGTSIAQTGAATAKVEEWLARQGEAKIVTAYIGQGAPRFFLAMGPELPDPSFAKIVVRTDGQDEREALKHRLREAIAAGLAPEARLRVTQLVFGPYTPFPVAYRVSGPDPDKLREIAAQVRDVLEASPMMRTVNSDWGTRSPTLHFKLQQDRLQALGLTSSAVALQLQFLLSGVPVTAVREDIRTVQVVARSSGDLRFDPSRVQDFTLAGADGQRIPLSQIGEVEVRTEEPVVRRRDRVPTITVQGDIAEGLQPPDVSGALTRQLQPLVARLPEGYRIREAGAIEESGKALDAMLPLFPIMLGLTLLILIFQVRSIPAMVMVFLTSPLGLIGVVPTLILFQQPFGINALVGLIALSGILMRNTLILIGQIHHNAAAGLSPFDAVVEATVQRARPVILTALAAVLAFIPLTHSVFWGTLAYTLIGGTLAGTVLTLVFLPAMYAIWFGIRPGDDRQRPATASRSTPPSTSPAPPRRNPA